MFRLVAFLLLTTAAFAQNESVLMLHSQFGQGSAVLVYKSPPRADGASQGLAATAYHVLCDQNKVLIREPVFEGVFSNGQVTGRVNYAVGDEKHDLALVWLLAPPTIPAVKLADTDKLLPVVDEDFTPRESHLAKFFGFANGKPKETSGRPSFRHEGNIQSDAIVLPGQSGGAMFVEGKLTGIISGGMDWYSSKGKATVTWPTRCADAKLIQPLINEALKALTKP